MANDFCEEFAKVQQKNWLKTIIVSIEISRTE